MTTFEIGMICFTIMVVAQAVVSIYKVKHKTARFETRVVDLENRFATLQNNINKEADLLEE